jgi:GR25 family glycosyltransferase involved in LPS biosynthesis
MKITIEEIPERKTICLNMIVKNEAKIIKDKLEKLCKKVNFDYWVISDTGSTDKTMEIIQTFFQEQGIPGELFQDEWKDFGYNRTQAINHAFQKSDYLLIFDADDEIIGDFVLPDDFGKYDSYHVYFGSESFKYLRLPIVNNRKRWKYVGVLHEIISEIDKGQTSSIIKGNYFFESGRSSSRNENPNKYYDDAIILEKAFKLELESPDGDRGLAHRYAFYCAQSYKDCGSKYLDNAIEWYKKVLTLENWIQEKFISCITLGDLYKSKNDKENAIKYWLKSVEYDNERIEGIVNAAEEYRNNGIHILANALYHKFKNYKKSFEDKLFLYKNKYNDMLEYQNCVSAFYVNDYDSGYECCKRILINRLQSLTIMCSSLSNMFFYKESLIKNQDNDSLLLFYKIQELFYDIKKAKQNYEESYFKVWNELFKKNETYFIKYPEKGIIEKIKNTDKTPIIFISFTTCKRIELFQKTVNSILNQWTDYDKIDYWFCVDDNSCDEDRIKMKELYPWMDFYFKEVCEKGHRESMNIIWNKLKTLKPTYWIHMEDDFLFHNKMDYIGTAIKGIEKLSYHNVKQILFNVNYAETIDDYHIIKGDQIHDGLEEYSLHVHKKGNFNYLNSHYWPHYSFRPSLTDVNTILELGDFNSDNKFFEMDYANKWTNSGYKSGFFNQITCRHIGRLTSERNDITKINSYSLNNESQFYENEATLKNQKLQKSLPLKISDMTDYIDSPSLSTPIKIINLLKREDRKSKMIETLTNLNFKEDEYEFVKGIDGAILEPIDDIKELFKGNDFGNRRGFIGCALTHLNLWKHLLNDENNDYYIIMEDDIQICQNFKEKINMLKPKLLSCEVLFLGYHMCSHERNKFSHMYNDISNINSNTFSEIDIHKLDKSLYIGGYFCYSINKIGAKGMIDYIEKNRIKHGIDYLNKINDEPTCYEIRPQLVFSDWNENNKKIDTNIQTNYDSLDFTDNILKEKLKSEFIFVKGKDQINNDIYSCKPFADCLEIAINDDSCVGFNTLGFLKSKITKLTSSSYFGENDGIYIKKEVYEKNINTKIIKKEHAIRIKLICDWQSSENLCNSLKNKYDDEINYCFDNMQFTWDDNDIDYYVILNRPVAGLNEYYEPEKTIIFQMEPWVNDDSKPWGTKTWGEWAKPDETKFLHVNSHNKYLNNVEWHINLPLSELSKEIKFDKIDKISAICSSKNYDYGHILRNKFIKHIFEQDSSLIHVYGRINYHNFKCYVGPLKDDNKYNGMYQYKYHLACENNFENGYATEKIWDAILSETLCFYWGCPNLEKYIDSNAFVRLDFTDINKCIDTIKQAIDEDWWSQRINIIRKEKKRIIEELWFFPNLKKIIESKRTELEPESNLIIEI